MSAAQKGSVSVSTSAKMPQRFWNGSTVTWRHCQLVCWRTACRQWPSRRFSRRVLFEHWSRRKFFRNLDACTDVRSFYRIYGQTFEVEAPMYGTKSVLPGVLTLSWLQSGLHTIKCLRIARTGERSDVKGWKWRGLKPSLVKSRALSLVLLYKLRLWSFSLWPCTLILWHKCWY